MNWALIIPAIPAVIAAAVSWLNHRRIAEVHVLVNSQLASVLARVDQLTGALTDAGADVPDPPAVPPPASRV